MRRAALFAALFVAFAARAGGGRTLFIESAVENDDDTATFPLYRGTSNGQTVWYVIFNSSDGADADAAVRGGVGVHRELPDRQRGIGPVPRESARAGSRFRYCENPSSW
jgi:hypothetical protein